jgi:hypothetical protein
MANINDAENAYLMAQAQTQEWAAQFLAEWYGPLIDIAKLEMYSSLNPMVVAQLKQMNPDAWDKFEAEVQQIKDKYNGSV